MATAPELDAATKAMLARKVERLVGMGMDRKAARRVVWDDYQTEQAALPPAPMMATGAEAPAATPACRRFWNARDEPVLTPDWLDRNRQQLARVKQLIGARSK
jgi:hypothetical protein